MQAWPGMGSAPPNPNGTPGATGNPGEQGSQALQVPLPLPGQKAEGQQPQGFGGTRIMIPPGTTYNPDTQVRTLAFCRSSQLTLILDCHVSRIGQGVPS